MRIRLLSLVERVLAALDSGDKAAMLQERQTE
jgi:hypothetical protein